MRPTLVVIDMQTTFRASFKPSVVVGVTTEIIKAKEKLLPIVVVEYKNCHPTHKALLDLLKNYPHKARITKSGDDGSSEVIRTLRRRGFNQDYIRVCGVNTDACVWATAEGLLKKLRYAQIEVVKSACATEFDFNWRRYFKHRRMILI